MNSKQYIEHAVENMFTSENEKKIMYAYLFRILLDWTPKEVGSYLKLSQVHVNMLNTTRFCLLASDTYQGQIFIVNHNLCLETCEKYVTLKHIQKHYEGSMITTERLKSMITDLQN